MLFVIVVRSFKAGYYGTGAASLWVWLERQLSQFSFSFMMDNTVSQPWGIGQYALSLAAGTMFVMLLSKLCVRIFGQAFDRIHIQAYDMTARVKRSVARLSL